MARNGMTTETEDKAPAIGSDGVVGDNAKVELNSLVSRIENLEVKKGEIADDIKEIYTEAKSSGFDTKVIRAAIRLRKQDQAERKEFEIILETYMHALGEFSSTPLGLAAIERLKHSA